MDFGNMRVSHLFRKLFFPTLLGLISSVLLNLADGIFVGRGVGSDGLAAINIAAPLFQISTGIALMFGSGVSVVAAIHLSKGNRKAANINVTQAFTVGMLLMALSSHFAPFTAEAQQARIYKIGKLSRKKRAL